MKRLTMILMLVGMTACNEKADVNKEAQLSNVPASPVADDSSTSPAVDVDGLLSNLNAELRLPRRDLHTQPSYLPNGSYSAYGEVLDCQNNDMLFPGDFTIYSDGSATFWNSIEESVIMGFQNDGVLRDNSISMLSTTTNHQGSSFKYEYLGQAKWLVTFNASCTRIYHCHVGACLE